MSEVRLKRHYSNFFFHLNRIDHHNCVPGTSVEERPLRALAGALVTADAQNRIDLDPPNGYRIQGEGQGGAAGFAKGGAKAAASE